MLNGRRDDQCRLSHSTTNYGCSAGGVQSPDTPVTSGNRMMLSLGQKLFQKLHGQPEKDRLQKYFREKFGSLEELIMTIAKKKMMFGIQTTGLCGIKRQRQFHGVL